jgi:hypothetical protein
VEGNEAFPPSLKRLPSPRRAGGGPSRPECREAGARERQPLREGAGPAQFAKERIPLATSGDMLGTNAPITPARAFRRIPFDAAIGAPDARDVLADTLFKSRLPRSELEAEPIFDHGEPSTDQRGCAGKAARVAHHPGRKTNLSALLP